ncbi:tubulin epsilon chain-like [Convolutriloba macropyga]|uniref:tubulin epsilon chain-like n=1 Tax=Convolutriloba macropyga TaxID=536237 RepID=UPI003F524790
MFHCDIMTQSIVVSIGQCGNQIGSRFWDLALREHATINQQNIFDSSFQSFFRNVDEKTRQEVGVGGKVCNLKARAVMIDMEERVINSVMQGPLRDLFEHTQTVTDVSGSGNNWAVGFYDYGTRYEESIVDVIRKACEHCDALQCFFLLHSMGGGTGSGLGTRALSILHDNFPDIYRFVVPVYPSIDQDDVITSPYNSVLAMHQLTEHADVILPIENMALDRLVNSVTKKLTQSGDSLGSSQTWGAKAISASCYSSAGETSSKINSQSALTRNTGSLQKEEMAFDAMNNLVAHLLLNLTASSRFEGSLNVDLNEVTMNMVPFPRMQYLTSSQCPLYSLKDLKLPARNLDAMFTNSFSAEYHLLEVDPKHDVYVACALLLRGANVTLSDVRRNIDRMRKQTKFIHWNEEGWKAGICSAPPVGLPYSLLNLSNNLCIRHTFVNLENRFMKLYRRKANLHHYTRVDQMSADVMAEAAESLRSQILEYEGLALQANNPPPDIPRLKVL